MRGEAASAEDEPMDQGAYYLRTTSKQAIQATENRQKTLKEFWKGFNVYSAVKNIGECGAEVTQSNMNGVWKNVCPSLVNDLKGFDSEFIDEAKHNLNLDMDESDSNELPDSHDSELNSEDLMELGKQMENDENDEVVLRQFTLKNMASAFELLEKSMVLFADQDPNVERFAKVYRAVEDAVSCYTQIYEEMRYAAKQSSILQFLKQPEHASTSSPASTPSRSITPSCSSTPSRCSSPTSSPDSPDALPTSTSPQ
ncbi:hypothetical protein Pcinc_029917 [Petrolisthes cinctipes]|uniref:Uncharacterized protein n=1 Tax=Petrolisthes cinctipes TaxID=88211 RepID=A0AAE1K516_PETCI|nr:hypothetical protein Pcinc_029917 [Petrolisthes cinctipes]